MKAKKCYFGSYKKFSYHGSNISLTIRGSIMFKNNFQLNFQSSNQLYFAHYIQGMVTSQIWLCVDYMSHNKPMRSKQIMITCLAVKMCVYMYVYEYMYLIGDTLLCGLRTNTVYKYKHTSVCSWDAPSLYSPIS